MSNEREHSSPAADDTGVVLTRVDGVATLTFNRPERKNALTAEMLGELHAHLDTLMGDDTTRVVVVTGVGNAFSAGADMSATPTNTRGALTIMSDAVRRLYHLPIPTIAAVNGPAMGLGASLALACDLVLAARSARFGQTFALRGLSLDGGASWQLPRIVGTQRAKRMAFFGEVVDSDDALEMGLCAEVVEDSDLATTSDEWATRIADGAPVALRHIKALIDAAASLSFDQSVERELEAQLDCFSTEDFKEGFRAFLKKRSPNFKGR
ncbi:MAG TPA: enoyl-CoA hydratase-related protein [Propionibacteriaceae bacterium]